MTALDPIELANEFATVTVRVVETRNGLRLRIESGHRAIDLDPLELEVLTGQTHDLFTDLLAEPFGSDEIDEP